MIGCYRMCQKVREEETIKGKEMWQGQSESLKGEKRPEY